MTFSKYNRKDIVQSIYCYEDTDILINKLDIKGIHLLQEAETEYTAQKLLELEALPLKGRFSLSHLQGIHKYIFQDIYPFAGKIRQEDISRGNTLFARSQYIKSNLINLLLDLKKEKYLTALERNNFCCRTAFYMAELNIIHPFREGNGRVIREFIRCLALKCGYVINWNSVYNNILLEASILSVNDTAELAKCIDLCIEKE